MLDRNNKNKRSVPLALQMNKTILDAIRSINTGVEKEFVGARCPNCHQMMAARDFPRHGKECTGGAA